MATIAPICLTPTRLQSVGVFDVAALNELDLSKELRFKNYPLILQLLKNALKEFVSMGEPQPAQDADEEGGVLYLYDGRVPNYADDHIPWKKTRMSVKLIVHSPKKHIYKLKNHKLDEGAPVMRRQTWQGEGSGAGWRKNEYKLVNRDTYYKPEDDGSFSVNQQQSLQDFPVLVHYFRKGHSKARSSRSHDQSGSSRILDSGESDDSEVDFSGSCGRKRKTNTPSDFFDTGFSSALSFPADSLNVIEQVPSSPSALTGHQGPLLFQNFDNDPYFLGLPSNPFSAAQTHSHHRLHHSPSPQPPPEQQQQQQQQQYHQEMIKREIESDNEHDGFSSLFDIPFSFRDFAINPPAPKVAKKGEVASLPVVTPMSSLEIKSYAPDVAAAGTNQKVIVVLPVYNSVLRPDRTYEYSCNFEGIEVPATCIAPGVIEFHTPRHTAGIVYFWVCCRESRSEVVYSNTVPFYFEPCDEFGRLSLASHSLSSDSLCREMIRKFRHSVRHLDLTGNFITDFDFLSDFVNLHTLVLDSNNISSQSALPHLPRLTTLLLNNNHIADIGSFVERLAVCCPELRHLSFLENPACQVPVHHQYNTRIFIISKFKRLTHLDSAAVTAEERRHAASIQEEFDDTDV